MRQTSPYPTLSKNQSPVSTTLPDDATVYSEILQWSEDRPLWIRDALRRIITQPG